LAAPDRNDPDATPPEPWRRDDLAGDEAGETQAMSMDALLKWLTVLFQTCQGCENVAVVGVTRLDRPDRDGCNWSTSLVLDPAGVAPEVYGLAYARLIAWARKSCNLK